ncbi:MAG: hypothetical protein ACJ8FY_12085 [Gemmataceae bacterium]
MKRSILISTSLALLAVGFWLPRDCYAGPFYLAQVLAGDNHQRESTTASGALPVKISTQFPDFGNFASAGASPGSLSAFAFFQPAEHFGGVGSGFAQGIALFDLDDVTISSPFPTGTTLSTQLNLHVSGVVGFSGFDLGSFSNDAVLDVQATVVGTGFVGGIFSRFSTTGLLQIESSGMLSAVSPGVQLTDELGIFDERVKIDANFSTPQFEAPVNQPFRVELELLVQGIARGGNGFSSGSADFEKTFTFATSGPVFNLPDSYTVNSVEGGIVNNRYGSSVTAAVPEPASLTLLILGGLGMIGSGWLRRGRVIASPQIWSMPSFATPT